MNNPPRLARTRRSRARGDAAGGMQAGPSDRRGMERVRPGAGGCCQRRQLLLPNIDLQRSSVADAPWSGVEGEVKLLPPLFLMRPMGKNLNHLKLTGTCPWQSLK